MNTKEQIAVMTAYTEGKIIQMRRHNSDKWDDVLIENVLWNWCDCDYRVKPECNLPKTWEEFCKYYPIEDDEVFIGEDSEVCLAYEGGYVRCAIQDAHLLPNEQIAESMLALCKLLQLRECYNRGWTPDWSDTTYKYVIIIHGNDIECADTINDHHVLVFENEELRNLFLENFRKLIEIAKPLL